MMEELTIQEQKKVASLIESIANNRKLNIKEASLSPTFKTESFVIDLEQAVIDLINQIVKQEGEVVDNE